MSDKRVQRFPRFILRGSVKQARRTGKVVRFPRERKRHPRKVKSAA